MKFSIIPYSGDSPMSPWPSLAGKAFCLIDNSRPEDTVFFFDSSPDLPYAGPPRSSAPPALVFIHGLGDEADSWRHLIPLLNARGFRTLALDLPGFGRSAAAGRINIKKHADAVIKLLETIGGASPSPGNASSPPLQFLLAGNSMGTMIAEMVAIKKPELVQGLILIDGTIPGGPANPGFLVLAKLLFSRKWYRAYRDDPERAQASLYPYYADFEAMPWEDREFLRRRVMARVESSTQERAFFATQRSLIWNYLKASWFARHIKEFKGKILLIWGEKDRIIPKSSANVFINLRRDAEMNVISGAGHLPQQERPEETAEIIAGFVAGFVANIAAKFIDRN